MIIQRHVIGTIGEPHPCERMVAAVRGPEIVVFNP